MRLLQLLRTVALVKKGGNSPALLLQALMLMRRTPMGMLEMFLLRKLLAGDGRLFGMDLSSRRQARMAWLVALLQRYGVFAGAKAPQPGKPERKLLP